MALTLHWAAVRKCKWQAEQETQIELQSGTRTTETQHSYDWQVLTWVRLSLSLSRLYIGYKVIGQIDIIGYLADS